MAEPERLIPPHGGYRKLKSFQVAQLVYDVTVRFCGRYINKRSRTWDQMEQAARSGVQNIAEGSQASGTSRKIELTLTNVARSSLEELKLDYQDFLRHRGLPQWQREDPRRAELIARRCTTADAVAAWAKDIHDGQHGPSGHCGQGEAPKRSTPSKKSASSTPSTPPALNPKSEIRNHPAPPDSCLSLVTYHSRSPAAGLRVEYGGHGIAPAQIHADKPEKHWTPSIP